MSIDVSKVQLLDYIENNSAILLLEIDRNGLIIKANHYAKEITGMPLEGNSIEDFFTEFNATLDVSSLKEKPIEKMMLNINTRHNIPETFYFSSFLSGETIFIVGETNSIEVEDLRKTMLSLNNELNNLTRELQKRNVQLDQLNHMKNQFLGMAAHDLRNPIGNIMMYSEFVLSKGTEKLTPDVSEIIKIIHRSSQFMLSLLDDLLDIVKIESGKLDLKCELQSVSDFLRQNVKINSLMASRKQIKIVLNLPETLPIIPFDDQKITQVLNNLISNAIKFSLPETTIIVSAFQTENEVYISVKDQGQGIPKAELDSLFKPFSRTSVRATAGEKSTGLGLNIAKRIIIGHQGRIWVESEVGAGTTFTFCLPINQK